MFRFIEKLRQKPEKTRKRYAFGVSFSIVLIIALVWGVTLPSRLHETNSLSEPDNGPSPLDSLVRNFQSGFSSVQQSLQYNPFAKVSTSSVSVNNISSSTPEATTSNSLNQVIISDPQ